MLWTQEPDGCVHPVDEDLLFTESPIFHDIMCERQIACLSNKYRI